MIIYSKKISIPETSLDGFIDGLTELGYSALYFDFSIVCYRDRNKIADIIIFGEKILNDIQIKELLLEYLI